MRVAVVGTGISGLGAAYLLDRAHDVTVFERDSRAGGHAHTIRHDGLALDTGFLVHNTHNYPLLGRLFGELGVRTQESQMSFSVGCATCGLEYSGRRPFAQRRSLASPRFAALLWEIARWLRTARCSLDEADYEQHTLEAYLDERGYSRRFRRHFLVPLTSALWSTAPGRALEFPAAYAIRFFDNHGMLGLRRFAWRTVSGGSDTYVRALSERLGTKLQLGLGARSLRRDRDGIELTADDGARHRFDKVVIATHADQALMLLEDPSGDERRVLGAFAYTRNEAVLHTDERLLPRARSARAAWNYRLGDDGRPTVTYSLNRLQSIPGEKEYCVTLNQPVDDEHVIRRLTYEHPLFTVEALRAQRELPELSGPRHVHFAGAHHGNGFHEDGLASGVRAADELGATW
ncbi:MAG: FAD-dependent oxidoreductase [Gaiellaceae bacterium MAG52_C11]|nr:FAD-dependent oxidoreductase [Candidatus Gaiellasilicea maunaloa]